MEKVEKISLTKVFLTPNEMGMLLNVLWAVQYDGSWHESIKEIARKLLEKINQPIKG